MTTWEEVFKYFGDKETKVRNIDTCPFKTFERLQENIKKNIPNFSNEEYQEIVIKNVQEKKLNGGTGSSIRCKMFINDIDFTPIVEHKRNEGGSKAAIRQYLEMFLLIGFIKPIKISGELIPKIFGETITIPIGNKYSIENIENSLINNILVHGPNNPFKNIEEIFYTLLLYLFAEFDKKSLINYNKNIPIFKKQARGKVEKRIKFSEEKDINSFLDKYGNTFRKISELLKDYFLNFKDSKMLEIVIEGITGKDVEIPTTFEEIKIPTILFKEIKEIEIEIKKARTIAQNKKKDYQREFKDYFLDIVGYDNLPTPVIDAAHIKSVKKIKQEIWMEYKDVNCFSKSIKEKIEEIKDVDNMILLPHHIHYLLDKYLLTLSQDGNISKINIDNLEDKSRQEEVENLYKNFGIEDNYQLKELNENSIKYIKQR